MQTWTVSQIHGTSAIRACLVLTDPNSNAVLMKLVAALRQRLDISTIQIIQTNRAFVCRISATASRSTARCRSRTSPRIIIYFTRVISARILVSMLSLLLIIFLIKIIIKRCPYRYSDQNSKRYSWICHSETQIYNETHYRGLWTSPRLIGLSGR